MLVIFDCDGVIVDSEVIASEVEAEMLTKLGFEITAQEVTRRFAGMNSVAIKAVVERELGHALPETFLDDHEETLDRRLAAELKPVAAIREAAERLAGPRCVCSNSPSKRLKIEFDKTGLGDVFEPYVFSAVEVGTREPKPSPNVYRYAMEQFRAAPEDTVVVEDSVSGVTAARGAGARVIGFTGGSHTWPGHADLLTDAGAETVINRFSDLAPTVEALASWAGLGD